MVLAVKIGNTTVALGGFEDDRLVFSASIETRRESQPVDFAASILSVLSLYQVSDQQISGAAISSVVPSLTHTVYQGLELLGISQILVVSSGTKTGLKIKKQNSNLGTDFVCMAVGAMNDYPLPCMIVSLGTATVFFGIDETGCLLGTSITAGVRISMEALHRYTSKLPETELEAPHQLMGGNSADSIKSGIIYGTASMVDGMCARYREELGAGAPCIVTGQYAASILPYCKGEYQYDETLLLRGLYRIYRRNTDS